MGKFLGFVSLAVVAPLIGLSACGHTMQERAASGAAAGLVVGGPVGAAVGATAGAAVDKVDDAKKEHDKKQ